MNIKLNFKNLEPSEHLKRYAQDRFIKLQKYVKKPENTEIQVNLEVEKFRQKAEVLLVGEELNISAFEESQDMYSTIDMVLDKVEAQARKTRDKIKDKRRGGRAPSVRTDILAFTRSDSGERVQNIVQTDRYEPKPMTVDEAALQLESNDLEFLVFQNAESESINVLYKRNNGDFGLIDPGM